MRKKLESSVMNGTTATITSGKLKSKVSKESLPPPRQTHKNREQVAHQKLVVTVNTEGSDKKQKKEGSPPSDCWSWRKYGQKPIKGSPFPRGYYRCSTSKGCLAKKQVERCRTDPSLLIITYTSTHNHAAPRDILQEIKEKSSSPLTKEPQEEEEPEKEHKKKEEDHFHYCHSPLGDSQDIVNVINTEHILETTYELSPANSLDCENFPSYPHLTTLSAPKTEENDFYDELEELPTSSFFSSFMRKSFFEERILVNPS